MQLLHPDDYAALNLTDAWVEQIMQEYEAKWLLDNTKVNDSILELGYGDGVITRALVKAGRNVVTVDGSHLLADAAERDGAIGVCCMFEDLELAIKHDVVLASFVLEHVADPVKVLSKAREWSDRLIAVVGNANSYHRQLAVKMGIQPRLDSLSERDVKVGHHRVYSPDTIAADLTKSGWKIVRTAPLMFKPVHNALLAEQSPALIRAMCEIECPPDCAANLIIECRKF